MLDSTRTNIKRFFILWNIKGTKLNCKIFLFVRFVGSKGEGKQSRFFVHIAQLRDSSRSLEIFARRQKDLIGKKSWTNRVSFLRGKREAGATPEALKSLYRDGISVLE